MKNLYLLLVGLFIISVNLFAQVAVNNDGALPDPSAGLDVKFNNKGVLLPRLTLTQISLIPNPANGLVVFCSTDNKFYAYISSENTWKEILYGTGTISQFSCGTSITINHQVGYVSPVNKTVTYGTVTNIPGEPSKCWITSNLGADHQAITVDDAAEASSGWYWQFNRKQGYKHNGTTRTPNTTWIGYISENLDWQAANDPCAIELGTGWRIPTSTEWTNVDAIGGWTTWTGPWNSGLIIHAAGFMLSDNGSLEHRGSVGYLWSSSAQGSDIAGWFLHFNSSLSDVDFYFKAGGFSVRCVRE